MASKYWWFLPLITIATIIFIASILHTRIDLTQEKRYTISNATKEVLHQLDDRAEIDVFLKGDIPSGFQNLANSTADFLDLLKENNSSKIVYRFISPDEEIPNSGGKTYADTLASLGVSPINLTVQIKQGQQSKLLFPVALVKYKGRQSVINLYPGSSRLISYNELNSAEAMLEYQFAKTFDALVNPVKPLVAYATGNGEPTGPNTYSMQQTLQKDYELHTFNISTQPFIPDTFKVVIIVKPATPFTDAEKLKIDQYVMRGGKLLCFIDELNAEQDSLQFQPQIVAYSRSLNLTDLLFHYGVRINPDLVMDLQCDFMPFGTGGSSDNPQYDFLHWNYYPLFESPNNNPINKNLGLVEGRFVNSIDTVKSPGITKTILLSSSANSRRIGTPALISLNENRNAPEDALFHQKNIPVAVLLEGSFTSFYRNRISRESIDSLSAMGVPYQAECTNPNKMIIVSDGDIVLNDFSQKDGPLPMGSNLFTVGSQYEYQFANKEFLQNCMEYLTNKQSIIETRNKDIVLRLLDNKKVAEQRTQWQLINIAAPIALVILFGIFFQWRRKLKYAS